MTVLKRRLGLSLAVTCVLLTLVACGSRSINRAPVEERVTRAGDVIGVVPSVKPPQGFEHAGKPGYYTVKPGDTLVQIALDNGQSYKDIARWSQVENPNRIEVGQILRIMPPVSEGVVIQPVNKPAVIAGGLTKPAATATAPVPTVEASTKSLPANNTVYDWIWPANGAVIAGFDEVNNRGINIKGVAGDPVYAAADGKVEVVATLHKYGKLVVVSHRPGVLTAYAHNREWMVKEDQLVKKGQQIAEMGDTQTDRVQLHFEIRIDGKPVDPIKYLPTR